MYQPIIPFEDIKGLPIPELALRLLAEESKSRDTNINSILRGLDQAISGPLRRDRDLFLERIADAWAWLVAHALVAPHPHNTSSGFMRITERGRELAADPKALSKLEGEELLSDNLSPELKSARSNFLLGDYETAAFAAMKAVEVEVRELAELPNDLIGVPLMRKAFSPKDGTLADPQAEGGEKQATADLFAGAIGAFKNPASHRSVKFSDPVEAAEITHLADLLLRIAARRTKAPEHDPGRS